MPFPDAALTHELNVREAAYWHDVDHNGGRLAHLWFLHDGVLQIAGRRVATRAAIEAFYRQRRERGPRVSRHVVTNCCAEYRADGREADYG
ncbi:MAG: hypothetical protein LCI02_23130 [Proteobacteria bacterium]|nr:hypothetical protein [Pseudomonadota bacterium]